MAKLVPVDEAAGRLEMTSQRLRMLCRERRIKGARFLGSRWYVPEDLTIAAIEPRGRGPALGSRK